MFYTIKTWQPTLVTPQSIKIGGFSEFRLVPALGHYPSAYRSETNCWGDVDGRRWSDGQTLQWRSIRYSGDILTQSNPRFTGGTTKQHKYNLIRKSCQWILSVSTHLHLVYFQVYKKLSKMCKSFVKGYYCLCLYPARRGWCTLYVDLHQVWNTDISYFAVAIKLSSVTSVKTSYIPNPLILLLVMFTPIASAMATQ